MKSKTEEYTYAVLESELELLKYDFPQTEIFSIGKSVWGRELYCIKIGSGHTVLSYSGTHHGMERITSMLLMSFVRGFLRAQKSGRKFFGYNISALAERATVYALPMMNPDGAELSANGLPDFLSDTERARLIEMNGGSRDFTLWQANANGVDLNHNYNALWKRSKEAEKEYGIRGAGRTRFSGEYPESEPETRALVRFTRKKGFGAVLAFHSQGEVIYHGFDGKLPPQSDKIAKAFCTVAPSYSVEAPEGIASFGGYKDWFVSEFMRPGFTIEVGKGKNPLPNECFPTVYRKTLPVMLGAMTLALP